jgi:hypothetical protein
MRLTSKRRIGTLTSSSGDPKFDSWRGSRLTLLRFSWFSSLSMWNTGIIPPNRPQPHFALRPSQSIFSHARHVTDAVCLGGNKKYYLQGVNEVERFNLRQWDDAGIKGVRKRRIYGTNMGEKQMSRFDHHILLPELATLVQSSNVSRTVLVLTLIVIIPCDWSIVSDAVSTELIV